METSTGVPRIATADPSPAEDILHAQPAQERAESADLGVEETGADAFNFGQEAAEAEDEEA